MKRVQKGEFGYIEYQRRWTIIRTVVYFAICMAVFAIGYFTTGTRRNLLTVVAVLGCLPACKSAVNAVMFVLAKGCSKPLHDRIDSLGIKMSGLYDLYMTTYKNNFPISHLVMSGKSIVGIVETANTDANTIQNHIKDHLKQDGYKDITVKIFTDTDKYIERLIQMSELDASAIPAQNSVLETLISISL